ncbi:hypothetical protein IG631_00416 [Alternaria alternata]|nr:hypothetical protein IG631_00416 [Alternaria alternata]
MDEAHASVSLYSSSKTCDCIAGSTKTKGLPFLLRTFTQDNNLIIQSKPERHVPCSSSVCDSYLDYQNGSIQSTDAFAVFESGVHSWVRSLEKQWLHLRLFSILQKVTEGDVMV